MLSKNNALTPVILGVDRSPPTELLSSLDPSPEAWLAVPNNQSQVDKANPTLQPTAFGMDFWESLEGQLVTVRTPTVTDFQNEFGEIFVYGDWPVTGKNSRGGLTMISGIYAHVLLYCVSSDLRASSGPDGQPDGNPETVIIGAPLDGTDNPVVAVGQTLTDITGVVFYQ